MLNIEAGSAPQSDYWGGGGGGGGWSHPAPTPLIIV